MEKLVTSIYEVSVISVTISGVKKYESLGIVVRWTG